MHLLFLKENDRATESFSQLDCVIHSLGTWCDWAYCHSQVCKWGGGHCILLTHGQLVELSQTSNPVCKVWLCRAGILSHSWAGAICSGGGGPAAAALSLIQFQDAGRPSAPFTDKEESCVLLHGELTGKQRLDLEPCGTVWFLAEQIQAFCRAATAFRKIALLWVNRRLASIYREELLFRHQTQVARELCLPSELVEAFMGFWVRPLPPIGWARQR